MSNPFEWLRIVRRVLSVILVIVALAGGLSGVTGGGQTDPLGLLRALVADGPEWTGDAQGDGGGGLVQFLAEIADLPLGGAVEDAPAGVVGPEPPTGGADAGVGGVLGGGVSEGPDQSTTPAPVESATLVPAVPTATATRTSNPNPDPTPAPQSTATTAPRQTPTVPASTPTVAARSTATATATSAPAAVRLDDPVLRFLPELRRAAEATGVPIEVLSAVARVESDGDPNLIVPGRGRGLMGVPDADLAARGVPRSAWHDPEANLTAGAHRLAGLFAQAGSWDGAVRAYFGSGCDASGLCAGEYAYTVDAWAAFYAAVIADPGGAGLPLLPPGWSPPAVAPYEGRGPRPLPLPPGIAAPTPTPAPTVPATATPSPSPPATASVPATATAAPTLPATATAVPPTETPTPIPTVPPDPTATPSPAPAART